MSNSKVLIADDSVFMRKVLKEILTEGGITNFLEAENGKDAVEKYKSERPGLILLDIVMPEMDGLEVLKQIGKEANVLVISAVGQEKMIDEAMHNGAKGYIVKPFDKEKVLEEIKKAI